MPRSGLYGPGQTSYGESPGWVAAQLTALGALIDALQAAVDAEEADLTAEAAARVAADDALMASLAGKQPTIAPGTFDLVGAPERLPQLTDEFRRGKMGAVGTAGRGVVSLRFDHQLDPFIAKVLPLMNARGLPGSMGVVTRSVGNLAAAYEPTAATWDDIKTKLLATGVEVWAHSCTHSDGVSLTDEIVNAKAEIEAALPTCRVMGWQQPGGPSTYGAPHTSAYGMDDAAGRLIRKTYGLYESNLVGTSRRMIPTHGCWGHSHYTIDSRSAATVKAVIDDAINYQVGIQLMLHSAYLDTTGYMTTATLTEILDYIVTKRDEGNLEVLTASALAFADPGSSHRPSLVPFGNFEGQTTSVIPPTWADSGAAWTIGTTGGRTGSNFLRIPAGQTIALSRLPDCEGYGVDGHAFEFQGWVRSTDYAPTWRVQFTAVIGGVNTVVKNTTAAIAQGPWARVRLPVVIPKGSQGLSVIIGRSGTTGTVDWDDVSFVAV